jgi:ppGpp synthetase/RelA/SpoT-type nucleotidyltranferase
MDAHGEMLLNQFRQRIPLLVELESLVLCRLKDALDRQHIEVTAIDHRIKKEDSLAGKLERKGAKYKSVDDITDLLGLRVITFYTDDVDKVAALVAQTFDIDWGNSVDKRKLHELDSFGYNSLHYICRLPAGSADEALCHIPFEIQMRTALQHVWSTINHDTGYKSDVQIPREYLRQFGRLAGMLELIDDEFSRLRNSLADYRRRVQNLVASGQLDEVSLNADTWESYLQTRPLDRLNRRIAAVNQAEIFPTPLGAFLPVLIALQMRTLGDVQRFIDSNADDAYLLAVSELGVTDLDILTESVGLQNLCIVQALKMGGGRPAIVRILDAVSTFGDNEVLAQSIYNHASALPFMNNK